MRIQERAAATVPRVHVSLQRDGDILLQARGDLDKKNSWNTKCHCHLSISIFNRRYYVILDRDLDF